MQKNRVVEVVWGVLVLFGFLVSQYISSMGYSTILYWWLWLLLAFVGKLATIYYPSRRLFSDQLVHSLYSLAIVVGLVATTLITYRIIPVSLVYLGIMWLIIIGVAQVIASYLSSQPMKSVVGIIWLIAALFMLYIPALIEMQFLVIGLVTSLPVIMLGAFMR